MRPTLIYAITDATTNEIRYVGKTVSPSVRWSKHKHDTSQTHHGRWLRSIQYNIEFIELEWVLDDWIEAERFWISYFKTLGARLTNYTGGGEGSHNPAPELRKIFSLRMLGNQHAKGYKHTSEALQKIADANRGKKKALGHRHDEATKKKIGLASKGKINSPETVEKMRQSHLAMSEKKREDMKRVWAERKANWVSKYDDNNIILDYLSGEVENKELLTKYGIGSSATLYKILRRNNISLKGDQA